MFIFAIVAVMAMSGYTELARQSERLTTNIQRVRAVQMAVMRLSQDFAELEPRPIRDQLGSGSVPALLADGRNETIAEFTRAGWSNPAGVPRATLQRVALRLENGKLYRDYWTVLDRTLANQPVQVVLLDQVRAVRLRFMASNRSWSTQWPATNSLGAAATPNPLNPSGAPTSAAYSLRPIAVELTLELEDWGVITRLIEVPG
jgi:general secretion pathway protein J